MTQERAQRIAEAWYRFQNAALGALAAEPELQLIISQNADAKARLNDGLDSIDVAVQALIPTVSTAIDMTVHASFVSRTP